MSRFLYSATTNGFYAKADGIDKAPSDAVEISDEFYESLFAGQAAGMQIVPDGAGYPVNAPPPAPPAPSYIELRAAEYPPITDYIDGVVKGDQAQVDKYVADCLAVKAKYPKPE